VDQVPPDVVRPGRMSPDDAKAFAAARPSSRVGVEDVSGQKAEVFQKDDDKWYFIVRQPDGTVVKESSQGFDDSDQATKAASGTFTGMTSTINTSRKYKTRPQ
jgi:hypothetical protein